MCNWQYLQSATPAICNMGKLQHVKSATCAICYTWNLQHVEFSIRSIYTTCNLQHVQFATCAISNTWKTNQLDGSARRISWTDHLDGPVLFTWSLSQFAYSKIDLSICTLSQLPSPTEALFHKKMQLHKKQLFFLSFSLLFGTMNHQGGTCISCEDLQGVPWELSKSICL